MSRIAVRTGMLVLFLIAVVSSVAVPARAQPAPKSPPAKPVAAPVAVSNKGSLDLAKLVVEAKAEHPRMAAVRRAAASAREVPSRVSSLPDPVVLFSASNLRIDDPTLDAHPMSGLVFGIAQGIPYPGKLARRGDVASARARAIERQVAERGNDVELRVRRLYWQLHFAEATETIVASNTKVLDMLADVVVARFSVGQGAQQDALQAQVAHSTLRSLLEQRKQVTISARRELNSAVGRSPTAVLAPTVNPPTDISLKKRAALVAQAKNANPSLLVASADIETAKLSVVEAKRDRMPDFQVGVGYRSRISAPGDASNGSDMVTVTFASTIPLWMGRKQNARVRENYERLWQRRAEHSAVELDVVTSVQSTIDAIERLDKELALYRKEVLPESDEALNASIADYQLGTVGFVSVLQNWRALLEADIRFEQLLSERSIVVAELRALVGIDPTVRGKK